jgi:hypothetical protein
MQFEIVDGNRWHGVGDWFGMVGIWEVESRT